MQGLPLKVPVPEVEKLTVPLGVDEPAPAVSVTVAVQVTACPTVTDDPQLAAVLVLRLFTVMANVPLPVL